MKQVFRQIPLYRFLSICNSECSDKKILDCGAGGNQPPLSLFKEYGYDTYGIENNDKQIDAAYEFSKLRDQELNIIKGNMKKLPYSDQEFDAVYSYNSIFHMKKEDIEESIIEIKRVLKTNGLLFLNFLSVDDFMCGIGIELGNMEFEQEEDNDKVIHVFHEDIEADRYFKDMKLIIKEKRILERMFEGEFIRQVYIDYIVKKIK